MIEEDEIGEEEKRQDIAELTTLSPVRVFEGVKQEKSSKKRIGGGSKPGTYAAQCVECMKWRKFPNKEIFEEIRELAERDPFVCEKAREWTEGSQVSCQDELDLSPEGNERMWLMDKPCIPRPPNRWKRLVYLRKNPTGNKFVDIYYVSPCSKRLRSGTELAKFFDSNVHYKEQGVSLSQFNFQTPRPLLQVLSENSSKKKKKQHMDLKLGWRVVVATIIGFVGLACGTVGGVGGGGIFIPMLNLVVGFDTKSVAALSKCTSYRSFFRGIEMWKKETKLKQEESSRLPLLSGDGNNSANLKLKGFSVLMLLWSMFLVIQILKNNAAVCGAEYWILNIL